MIKYGNKIVFQPEKLHPLNIDRQTIDLVQSNSNILEIGCATGFMGGYLKKHKNCKVTGVELREEEANIAKKHLDNVIIGNIEETEIQDNIIGKYDIILASALVQQLKDPKKTTTQWKKFLKKDGYLLITASNIAHWTTRKEILLGNFSYEDYGLMDDAHLRFYTINSFKKLIEDSGYKIINFKIDPVGGGYPKISSIMSNISPGLFTYQMLIKAKVK